MSKEELKLLGIWSSPFTLRVVCALRLKSLEYEYIEEDFSNKSPLLLQYNPVYKKIPVLVHNGNPLPESSIILEYIDDMWKHNPLLPEDPYEKATTRFWIKFADDKLLPSAWNSFITRGKEQEEHFLAAVENLKIIEGVVKENNILAGEAISLLDIFLLSIVNLINILDEITELKINEKGKFPALAAWIDKLSTLPLIVGALPPQDKMVSKLRDYREHQVRSATEQSRS